jgi:hypothetical protein
LLGAHSVFAVASGDGAEANSSPRAIVPQKIRPTATSEAITGDHLERLITRLLMKKK